MKATTKTMKSTSFEVSESSRNNLINVSQSHIRPDPLLSAGMLVRLLLSAGKLGSKQNKTNTEGRVKQRSEEILRYRAKKGHKGHKGHKGRRGRRGDVRLWVDFASGRSRYATLTG